MGSKALVLGQPYSRLGGPISPLEPSRENPPPGRLYVVERPASCGDEQPAAAREVAEAGPVRVSNGLGWSPDHTTFYHIDSPSKAVYAYDYSAFDGALSRRRLLRDTSEILPEAEPDGLAVDAEGCLWVAMWNGGAVLRLRPDGSLAAIARTPGARFAAAVLKRFLVAKLSQV